MRKIVLGVLLALLFGSVDALAQGTPSQMWCWNGVTSGPAQWGPCSSANPLSVTASITPSGTQNVNLTQILGAVPSLGNPLWVFPATGATFPVSGSLTVTQSGTSTTQLAGQTFTNVTTNTDTVIKNTPGTFVGLSVNTIGNASSATVFDNTTCTGTKIGTYSTILQNALIINAAAATGICVTTAGVGAADITVLWR